MAFDKEFSLSNISGSTCQNKVTFGIFVKHLRENLHSKFQPFLRRWVKWSWFDDFTWNDPNIKGQLHTLLTLQFLCNSCSVSSNELFPPNLNYLYDVLINWSHYFVKSFQAKARGVFRTLSNIQEGVFCKND